MGFEHLPFGPVGIAVIGGYLVLLLGVGYWAKRKSTGETLSDFYLAGRGLGLAVLFLTLYATQYSGNTLLGFSGKGYTIGFAWLMSVQFMTAIVVAYLALAPRLSVLSREKNLVTPGDYVMLRYGRPGLTVCVTLIMIFVCGNFAVAQLKAMGKFFVALSGGELDLWVGVVTLALVMVVYETLGGMRAVAWTDALQGVILLAAFAVLMLVLRVEFGPLSEVTERLAASSPEHVIRPDGDMLREWVSWIVLFGLGASCYPMAIQRLYAARDQRTLRRSVALMAFMPLATTFVALVVGLYAAVHLVDALPDSDAALPTLCTLIIERSPIGPALVLILFAAFLAALMSTADSALLSLASMATRDLYARHLAPQADERHLAMVSKVVSWVVMACLVGLALVDMGGLIRILEMKLEMLVQVAPAFFLGPHSRVRGVSVLVGLIVGVCVTLLLAWLGYSKIAGMHAGSLALVLNVVSVFAVDRILRRRDAV
jgi:SSS family transporter